MDEPLFSGSEINLRKTIESQFKKSEYVVEACSACGNDQCTKTFSFINTPDFLIIQLLRSDRDVHNYACLSAPVVTIRSGKAIRRF